MDVKEYDYAYVVTLDNVAEIARKTSKDEAKLRAAIEEMKLKRPRYSYVVMKP